MRLGLFDVGVCVAELFLIEIQLGRVAMIPKQFVASVERRSDLDSCLEIVDLLLSLSPLDRYMEPRTRWT